ncbi:histidine kinase dimerization/phospho-acceptor domain-containing protein, partial [Candidatus Omnitrophota bacterium]
MNVFSLVCFMRKEKHKEIIRFSSLVIFLTIAFTTFVFASTSEVDPTGTTRNIVFGATGIFALVVGIILSFVARRSAIKQHDLRNGMRSKTLESAISDEVSDLLESGKNPNEVVKELITIFDDKVDERMVSAREKLDQKYGRIIEEKEQAVLDISNQCREVSEEKKQTESIVRSIAEGLVLVNDKGEVILMNPAAEKLLGVKKEDKMGRSIAEGLKEEQLLSLVKESPSGDKEIVVDSKNVDTKKILKSSGAVIEDENGKTVGMVTVLSDVTKQRELEEMKRDFLSSVSHELRTPIVAMEKSLSVMFDPSAGPLTQNQKQFLNIAKRNMDRLDFLINDLLDLSKLEAKKMKIDFEPSSIEKSINDTCATLETWAKTKEIKLEKNIQGGLPSINFDRYRIVQVLNNLIGNAIKFTPRDGKVTVEAKSLNDNKGIEVSVIDTGVGIAKEDIAKVF